MSLLHVIINARCGVTYIRSGEFTLKLIVKMGRETQSCIYKASWWEARAQHWNSSTRSPEITQEAWVNVNVALSRFRASKSFPVPITSSTRIPRVGFAGEHRHFTDFLLPLFCIAGSFKSLLTHKSNTQVLAHSPNSFMCIFHKLSKPPTLTNSSSVCPGLARDPTRQQAMGLLLILHHYHFLRRAQLLYFAHL